MLEGDTNMDNTNNQKEESTLSPNSFDIENQNAGDWVIIGTELLFKQGVNAWLWEDTVFRMMTKIICNGHLGYATVHPSLLWNDTKFSIEERAEVKSLNTFPKQHRKWHTLFVPICTDNHWYLAVLKRATHEVIWYDSFRRPTLSPTVKETLQWVFEVTTHTNVKLNFKGEGDYGTSHVQIDDFNCGPYTCMYAQHIISGEPMEFGKDELMQKRIHWFTLLATSQGFTSDHIESYIQEVEIQILGANTSKQTRYFEKIMNAESKSSKLTQKATMNPVRNVADASKVPSFQDIACDIENNTFVEKDKNINEHVNYIEQMETEKSAEPINTDGIESVEYNHPLRILQERTVNKRRKLQSNIAVTELEQMISNLDVEIEHDQKYNRNRHTSRLKKKRAQYANKLMSKIVQVNWRK